MDGTRDRPPGKNAENWSRKDGIRAGAVTGPWRSAPRADAGGKPLPQRTTPGVTPPGPERAPVRTAQQAATEAPAPETPAARRFPDTTPIPAPDPGRYDRTRTRRRLAMAGWIGFGLAAAVGLFIAALILRPAGDPAGPRIPGAPAEAPASATPPQPTETASTPEAAPSPLPPAQTASVPAASALATVSTVRLRVGPGFSETRRDEIVAALEAAGISDVQVEALPFSIATSRVGYYREGDKVAADAVAGLMGPVVGGGRPLGVRDYAALLTDPEPGRLDLWVSN